MDRPSGLRRSRDSNSPMIRFNPKLSHNFVTPFREFSDLFVVLISLMDPNVLRDCAQRLVETADFIRNKN